MTSPTPLEKGGKLYNQLNPVMQGFFDGVAARLCEAEVLFTPDVGRSARNVGLVWNDNRAAQVLDTIKAHNVLLHLNVVLGREHFGDGSYIRKRVTYFDKQFSATELQFTQSIADSHNSGNKVLDEVENRAVLQWNESVTQQHEEYLETLETMPLNQPMLPDVKTVLIPTRRRGGVVTWTERTVFE